MSHSSDSRGVKLARGHVEAWAHNDFDTARAGLATGITAAQSSTNPAVPRADLVGVDDYMHGLILFAQSIVPGSTQVTDSAGDDQYALLKVTTKVDGPPYGKLTIHNARLYRFDEDDKIAAEQVVFYVGQE